jgi:Raf kinase inhibitor-like YbhB/YbcL family protein
MKALSLLFAFGLCCEILAGQGASRKSFQLTVGGFPDRGSIPRHFTCDAENVSPPLMWAGEPPGTQSFALVVDDRDANGFVHWLVWDIPASVHSLAEGSAASGISGSNGFHERGYGGPCPPHSHLYAFLLLAVDLPSLHLSAGAGRQKLEDALRRHVLAKTEYDGTYGR